MTPRYNESIQESEYYEPKHSGVVMNSMQIPFLGLRHPWHCFSKAWVVVLSSSSASAPPVNFVYQSRI